MKKILPLVIAALVLLSCEKENEDPADIFVEYTSIAEDLQKIIVNEEVEALKWCCNNCDCDPPGSSLDFNYSFPGDNFVTIGPQTYNLNNLLTYRISTVDHSGNPVKRMLLIFP